ncbi:MAG: hypothetical protein MUC31_02410 [Bacteroidales bacterium]|jgi:hypothetical protein|nr:hypothetical protein [Bacteroidales bacterium]
MKKLNFILTVTVIVFAFGANAQWNTNVTHIYNTNTGNVGIGLMAPTTLLDVAKSMTEPTISVRNLGGSGGATFRMYDQASGAEWKFKATNTGGFKIRDQYYSLDVITVEANSAANVIYINAAGNVGIGTAAPAEKLAVNGNIKCKQVEVTLTGWSDFVFEPDYSLMPLAELDAYIKAHKHLPDVPSAEEVIANGNSLGEMDAILLQKIEELTLYMIELKKENEQLKALLTDKSE